ncbi:hypothetical protein [Streptomyces sp. NPDC090025]|uniref:hypothetical protein n=1 Tax=Streptomyces sp. NPDC090025 TaxID=3365922 RepID=UPI003834EBF8
MTNPSPFRSVPGSGAPRPVAVRPLTGSWRSLDWYVQETMAARGRGEAQAIVGERWRGPDTSALTERAARLARDQVEPVALRLAAISVNCGWSEVLTDTRSAAPGVPDSFARLWAVVAQRLGTVRFGAAPLLAVTNHSGAGLAVGGTRREPAVIWSDSTSPSRIDLFLAALARVDALNASSVATACPLGHVATLRRGSVLGVLNHVRRAQEYVQDLLARALETVARTPCAAVGVIAARTLVADAAASGVPPRLVTPAAQGLEAVLGVRSPIGVPPARRHLGHQQVRELVMLDRVGERVRAAAVWPAPEADAHIKAVVAVRRSNALLRLLADTVVDPRAAREFTRASRPSRPRADGEA